MKVTRETVAEKAGVSKQTVSYYFNNTRYISPKTIEKIKKAIEELNYIPNLTARTLVSKYSNLIGIVCNKLSNPHYSEVIAGLEYEAALLNYSVVICDVQFNPKQTIEQLIARSISGVILLTFPERLGENNIKSLKDRDIPIIFTHSAGERIVNHFQLEPDIEPAMYDVLNKLKELGHGHIAMLSAYNLDFHRDVRLKYFLQAHRDVFKKDGIVICSDCTDTSVENGQVLAKMLIEKFPHVTAVLATNDLMCFGALKTFKECNIKVPEAISIIGQDNLEFGKFTNPTLSTIGYNKFEYGKELFKLFLKAKEGEAPFLKLMKLDVILRDSVAKK